MIETTVIILNWNGARLLPACLSALARQTYRDFELVLVDNGSIDGSLRLLADLSSDLQPDWLDAPLPRKARLILNADNLGFAEGNNVALRDLQLPLCCLAQQRCHRRPALAGAPCGYHEGRPTRSWQRCIHDALFAPARYRGLGRASDTC